MADLIKDNQLWGNKNEYVTGFPGRLNKDNQIIQILSCNFKPRQITGGKMDEDTIKVLNALDDLIDTFEYRIIHMEIVVGSGKIKRKVPIKEDSFIMESINRAKRVSAEIKKAKALPLAS